MEDYAKSLREMYELGLKHGRELALKDIEIEELEEELNQLETLNGTSK